MTSGAFITTGRHTESVSFKKRRRILVLSLLSFILVTIILFRHVASAEEDEIINITQEDYRIIYDNMMEQNSALRSLHTIFSTSAPAPENNYSGSLLYSLMEEDHAVGKIGRDVISGVAMILILANVVIQTMQVLEREDHSIETMMRILLGAVIGMLAVLYIYDLLKGLETIGHAFYTAISKAVDGVINNNPLLSAENGENAISLSGELINAEDYVVGQDIANATAEQSSLKGGIFSSIAGFIGSFMLMFTFYSIIVSAYGLLFELVIRKILAPLAVADFTSEGVRSPGAKFLKNYFGVYLRMAMFAVIIFVGVLCMRFVIRNPDDAFRMNTQLGPIGAVCCIRLAMKAMLNASGSTAREILGG